MIELTRELLERYLRAAHGDAVPIAMSEDDRKTMLFRLGLCAAAEYDFSEALRLVDTPACFGLYRVGREKLIAAGITPEAWEAAK